MPLQEATDARQKKKISSVIKSLKDKVLEKQKEVEQFNQKSIAISIQSQDRGKTPNVILCRQNYCDHRSEQTRCFLCSR